MHSDYYAHPEFGFLSPTPRLRRELRTAFFSVLFGIGIGAAAMIALSGNNSSDDAPLHTSKPDGSTPEANSENHKTNATTTCDVNNSACLNVPSAAGKPRGMPMPAANDALAIGRAPLGRPDGSTGMTSASATSEAHAAEARSEGGAEARLSSNSLMDQKPHKIARGQNRPRQDAASYRDHRGASRIGRGYNRPAGELDRAYALDRSYGSRGFWDWSR